MVKKLALKVFMYGFVFFGLSLYAGYLMTGRLPSYVTNIGSFLSGARTQTGGQPNWSDIGSLKPKEGAENGNYEVMQGGKTTIYKWQDANGRWQYGERAPSTGTATKIEIATPPPPQAPSAQENNSQQAATSHRAELPNPYSPEGVKEIMDQAHDVQRLMNQRNSQLKEE